MPTPQVARAVTAEGVERPYYSSWELPVTPDPIPYEFISALLLVIVLGFAGGLWLWSLSWFDR